jgi:hypothetical protein
VESEPTATEAVAGAIASVGLTDEEREARQKVETVVRAFFKQFNADQLFDKAIRKQIRKDRLYASGQAQDNWAVSTNLIGSYIDIQVSTLYARDPDVSVRPAPQVDPPPDPLTGMVPPQPERQRNQDFAKSLELVLSALWKKGKLKNRMRRVIRSILSASHGWLKVLPVSEVMPDPLAQNEYNTLKENVQAVAGQIAALNAGQTLEGATASVDELTTQEAQLNEQLDALAGRLEVETCYGFTFDVVKPENMQVGTDVELLEEYLDSDANVESMYFPFDQLREMFPELRDEDLQSAEKFYRKAPKNANRGEAGTDDFGGDLISRMFPMNEGDDEMYTQNDAQEGAQPFAKVLEKWSKKDNHIYTAVCGVKVWARAPYKPSWASSRFYPYFYFSLNEVDGQRCPQSGSARGAKLQDEYATTRSNLRITRRRSIPGTIVDASMLDDTELDKIKSGVIAEMLPLRFNGSPGSADLSKMFGAKPTPNIDIRLYDTTPIIVDLERTFGVSETQAQSKSIETTATEEEIKAASANGRTATWRDTIETALSELAQYCAEVALQKIPPHVAAKIAGPAVYWPHGLALEDITSLVEVSIQAGTTGKPRNSGDREAWGVIYPLIKETVMQIAQLEATGQFGLAAALKEGVRETARRFGDEGDLNRFFPPPPLLPALPAPGAVPGAPLPGEDPAAPGPQGVGADAPQPPPEGQPPIDTPFIGQP